MAILPGKTCDECVEQGRERPAEHACEVPWGVVYLCNGCASAAYDRWQEDTFAAYHGGGGPQSLAEQYDAAAKQKRSQR